MSSLVVKKKVKVMGKIKPAKSMPPTLENSSFDLELCWCVQQLEKSLQSGKLSQREAERIEKAVKTLKSPKEVFIKKRQLMQQLLGDYRGKMKKEERKLALASNQIRFANNANPSKKSYFVKKSAFAATTGNNFKFNFAVDQIEKLDITDNAIDKTEEQKNNEKNYHFTPSGNIFRFAFDVDENVGDS